MHARVSRFRYPSGSAPTGDETGRQALQALRDADGFKGLISLEDPDGGRALAITLWDTAEAMGASEAHADRIRADGAAATGAEIVGVERYRVDLLELED